ncbi:helix-turn-helix protein [Tamilnaduibacter salinus]|uniref:Helix-turn-helix protein n=1 Tax=Tamilnaduibacter salinus TaxID=1484056 RepID=A0A2U1CUR4_9GAMM|nr:helix-turn-helix transcriptional regulator [Tamilnaduibacter salinus]PVY70799.1 helix-turn-helix protein [Tamilnaduibacter salinus]
MTVQVIEKEGAPEWAVIPYDEYQALLRLAEDAQDVADAHEAMRDVAEGKDELIPGDVVERLVSGDEHPLRVWRTYRGLTQEALGRSAGVGKSYVSQIESGRKTGSATMLSRLAKALNVDVDDLLMSDDVKGRVLDGVGP